jgi:hypothetical protein
MSLDDDESKDSDFTTTTRRGALVLGTTKGSPRPTKAKNSKL